MSEQAVYSRKNPFPAKLLVNRRLTGEGSNKDTRHYEVSLAGSGLEYVVGDSMGVFCQNDPELVDEIIARLALDPGEVVTSPAKRDLPLRQALLEDCIITQPDKKFLKAVVEKAQAAPLLAELLTPERKDDLAEYLWGLEVIDFLIEHQSVRFEAQEFVSLLRKLQPRLYSIASSLKAHPDEVHFTIATVEYESHGRKRKGVCSSWLAERVGDDPVPLFVHTAKGFRLPENGETPIIMVGPGTGIAPFRAYLEERSATGASGANWLFFGEQHSDTDFFYRDEFEGYQRAGLLTHFHTAFSRDQDHKIYVQDRLRENAAEIWQWLERDGAHFFVCGDAARMAKDVDKALHDIVQQEGGKSPDEAAAYVEALKKDHRYKRDVY